MSSYQDPRMMALMQARGAGAMPQRAAMPAPMPAPRMQFTPEQLAGLQQKQMLSPQTAQRIQANVRPLDARVQAAHPGAQGLRTGSGFAPMFRPGLGNTPMPQQRPAAPPEPPPDPLAGLASSFIPSRTSMTFTGTALPSGAFPRDFREKYNLTGGVVLSQLSDDDFFKALDLVEQNMAGKDQLENQKDIYAKFRAVLDQRPELMKKAQAMAAAEQEQENKASK